MIIKQLYHINGSISVCLKVGIMLNTTRSTMENVWNTFQEPRCSTYLPSSYMLLLSALDQGWQVIKVELSPSWDQYGFVYLVSLKHPSHQQIQLLIMPRNSLVANLLQEYSTKVPPIRTGVHQPA